MTQSGSEIRYASAEASDLRRAAASLYEDLQAERAAVVVLFIPPTLPRHDVAAALTERFGDIPVVGCSTAGEIGPSGVGEQGIVGFSLPASQFKVAIARIEGLAEFAFADGVPIVARLIEELEAGGGKASREQNFAMLLVDGLSTREEDIASALAAALQGIPLFGGSAGDGERFGATSILSDGQFASDAAIVMLVYTELPFWVFKSQHFASSDRKLVVTSADWASRTVFELDGLPAAAGYARAIGIAPDQLGPDVFAEHPVVVKVAGDSYVRSILRRNDDDSLTFYCAVEEGVVLSLANRDDIVNSVQETLADVRRHVGPPTLVVGCDCILRRQEVSGTPAVASLENLYRDHHVIGFGTYGEQFHGMHVNQTFTGVAIGETRRAAA